MGTTLEARQLAAVVVVLMPQIESFLQQLLQPGTEVSGTPRFGLQDLIDRAQRMGNALLLLDLFQFLGVVTGCDRASAKVFGGNRTIFGPRGPSVPITTMQKA